MRHLVGGMPAGRVTRLYTSETNGVVERLNQTLSYQHSFQYEIALAATVAEKVDSLPRTFNVVRPQVLGGESIHRTVLHLFRARVVREA